jgi:peroxiredoxin
MLAPRELVTIHSEIVRIPDPRRRVHLQFRRFAGCPICKLHLRSIAQRHGELISAGILVVAVFHSSVEIMRRHEGALPFHVIADPERKLYAAFGVEASVRSILDPRAWGAVARGIATFGLGNREWGEPALGLPADFLIAPSGRVLASKYGAHADDHWSVDEILALSGAEDRVPDSTSDTRRPVISQIKRRYSDA